MHVRLLEADPAINSPRLALTSQLHLLLRTDQMNGIPGYFSQKSITVNNSIRNEPITDTAKAATLKSGVQFLALFHYSILIQPNKI